MSNKLSVVPMKGAACAAMRGMSAKGLAEPFNPRHKWPASQSVQPDDAPPVLRSVDANDPPGRLPPPETEFEIAPLTTRINRLRRVHPLQLPGGMPGLMDEAHALAGPHRKPRPPIALRPWGIAGQSELQPKRETELDRVLAALERIVKNDR